MAVKIPNPWLQISSEDYEGHMSAPNVMQLQMLNKIFKEVLDEFNPQSVCILGCTAGNGFEHLLDRDIERVVAIDINRKYVAECRAWFVEDVSNLQLICADLDDLELHEPEFDLIHAALIFEYVDVARLIEKISRWLKPGGLLCAVLQLPGNGVSPISETKFVSLKLLKPFIHLVSHENFIERALDNGLVEVRNSVEEVFPGKSFYYGIFEKLS